jgi:hypothetical protein
MPFDNEEFVNFLRKNAGKHSRAQCARYVRLALEAAGADTSGHPAEAKRYANILLRNGFRPIQAASPGRQLFRKGDVVVMEPTQGGNQAGHIAAYDGKDWISDFIQSGFWPGPAYAKEEPTYVVYRR